MKKPNFFIVGAAKCGTTSLYRYLRQHPDVFMPEQKEPNFFGSDLSYRFPRISQARYLSCFAKAKGETRIGEATTIYLYSEKAAEEIKAFSPEAKIIIMLRNPVDVLYSYHSQQLYSGNEDIPDFEEALRAEVDRLGRLLGRDLSHWSRAGGEQAS